MNDLDIEKAQTELLACETRAKELRRYIQAYDSLRQNHAALFGDVQTSAPNHGKLIGTVRDIFDASPQTVFTTSQVRQLLESRGIETNRKHFISSLSTTLTRLGKSGFIVITTDGEGNRSYQRTAEMT